MYRFICGAAVLCLLLGSVVPAYTQQNNNIKHVQIKVNDGLTLSIAYQMIERHDCFIKAIEENGEPVDLSKPERIRHHTEFPYRPVSSATDGDPIPIPCNGFGIGAWK